MGSVRGDENVGVTESVGVGLRSRGGERVGTRSHEEADALEEAKMMLR